MSKRTDDVIRTPERKLAVVNLILFIFASFVLRCNVSMYIMSMVDGESSVSHAT